MITGRAGTLVVPLLALWCGGAIPAVASVPAPSHPKPAHRLDPPPNDAGGAGDAKDLPAGRDGDAGGDAAGERGVVLSDGSLALEVRVPRGAGNDWLRSYLKSPRDAALFRRTHGGRLPAPGATLRLPLALLGDDARARLLLDLAPGSGPAPGAWDHPVGAGRLPPGQESWRHLALWYTGNEKNAEVLQAFNGRIGRAPHPGRVVRVPEELLLPGFARLVGGAAAVAPAVAANGPQTAEPPPKPEAEEAGPSGDDFTEAGPPEGEGPLMTGPGPYPPAPVAEGAEDLSYGRDGEGPYAIYSLKKGEALYSAVVMRFTGRVDVQEVNDLAAAIARRSGIADVTNIRVGFKVRIPQDALLPEYLPLDDPRRQAWERSRADVAHYQNAARSRGLEGVAVILDAGHGGRDAGASHNGVWEHDYVYDILCRIKALLETTTRAKVLPTIRDSEEGYRIHDAKRLPMSRTGVLLTSPPLRLDGSHSSVNMRWYLSNSYFRRLTSQGIDPQKIVFTSLHADARHPSLRGAMIYVPGEEYRRGRYGSTRAAYAKYREARQEPYVVFSREERERSEGLSQQFADAVLRAFGRHGVAVDPYAPVRQRIIRGGRSWVPAVLRCNVVPVEILIEVSNLMNPADGAALANPDYRQRVAEAYVEALARYFGGPERSPSVAQASGR